MKFFFPFQIKKRIAKLWFAFSKVCFKSKHEKIKSRKKLTQINSYKIVTIVYGLKSLTEKQKIGTPPAFHSGQYGTYDQTTLLCLYSVLSDPVIILGLHAGPY